MKKALSFLMAGLMVFSLAACGSSGPKNAEELMTLVMENPADNYELSGEINMTVSMAGGGLSFEMPMDIEMTGAICGENSVAQSVVSASILGQDMEESVKAYLYDGQAYVLDSSTNTWSAGSQDTVDGVMELSGLMDKFCTPEQFADADMEHADGTYTITASILDVLGEDGSAEFFNFDGMMPSDEASNDIGSALSEGVLTYIVNEDYQIESIVMDTTEGTQTYEENGASYEGTVSLAMSFEFMNYGEVKDEDVTPPDEALSASDDKSSGMTEEELPPVDEPDVSGSESTAGIYTDHPEVSVNAASLGDYMGCYNGTNLVPGAFTIELFEDEFYWDESDVGQYSFLPLSSRNNDYVDLYLNDFQDTGELPGLFEAVYSYEFNIVSVYDESLPDVTFNGMTWGASRDDIVTAYGEPDYTYSDESGYWSVEFDVTELVNDGVDYSLSFTGDDNGVNGFRVSHYSF